jgi:hypothetical protein
MPTRDDVVFYAVLASGVGGIAGTLYTCGVFLFWIDKVMPMHGVTAVILIALYAITLAGVVYFRHRFITGTREHSCNISELEQTQSETLRLTKEAHKLDLVAAHSKGMRDFNDMVLEVNKPKLEIPPNVERYFNELTWAQRIALWRISTYPGLAEMNLFTYLSELGFSDIPDKILDPLLSTNLVERDGNFLLEPKAGREGVIAELLRRSPPLPPMSSH